MITCSHLGTQMDRKDGQFPWLADLVSWEKSHSFPTCALQGFPTLFDFSVWFVHQGH